MPAAGYTLATMIAGIQSDLGDPSGEYYTTAYITGFINDRMAAFCMRTKCRPYTWSVDLVADQVIYDLTTLAPRLIDLKAVGLPTAAGSTDQYALPRVELEWLEQKQPQWRTQDSSWPQMFARFTKGFDGLILVPACSSSQTATVNAGVFASSEYGIIADIDGLSAVDATSAYGITADVQFLVGTMRLDGIAHSTDASAGATTLESCGVPIQYQEAIRSGVKADCCGDLDVEIAQVQKAGQYEAEYEAGIALASQLVRNNFQGRPSASTYGSNC